MDDVILVIGALLGVRLEFMSQTITALVTLEILIRVSPYLWRRYLRGFLMVSVNSCWQSVS